VAGWIQDASVHVSVQLAGFESQPRVPGHRPDSLNSGMYSCFGILNICSLLFRHPIRFGFEYEFSGEAQLLELLRGKYLVCYSTPSNSKCTAKWRTA
jgi:hypothetical protein